MTLDLTFLKLEEAKRSDTLWCLDALRDHTADPELRDSLLVSHRLVNMRWQQARMALRDATDAALQDGAA
jgi:hypothetical protein